MSILEKEVKALKGDMKDLDIGAESGLQCEQNQFDSINQVRIETFDVWLEMEE